jgi:iron complex outermembrane receptor protein
MRVPFSRQKLSWWLCLLLVAPPAAAQQESPDTVYSLEPLLIRALTTAVGTGSARPIFVAGREELQRGTMGAFLEEALRAFPGLQIQNRFNLASGERLAVRGFGSRAQFGIRGVRVLVDGIPATLPDGQTALDHLDLSSLARVELLRGPGASLYGNAAGGVIHFRSLPPTVTPVRAEVRTAGGSHGLRTYIGILTGSAGTSGFRIGVSRFIYDGFRIDPLADDGSLYGAADRTIVSGTLTLPLRGGNFRLVFNGLDLDAENPGSLSKSLLNEKDRQAYRFNVIQRTHEDIRQGQAGVTWTGSLAGVTSELSAWGVRREFEGRIPPSIVVFERATAGVRVLAKRSVDSGAGLLSLGGGFEAELQDDDRQNWENDGGARGPISLDQQEKVRSLGLFLQGRMDLSSRFAVVSGLRYDRFTFRAHDRFLQDGSDDSGNREMGSFSPSTGFVWIPGGHFEIFGSAATSFETPTTTELANQPSGTGGLSPSLKPTRGLTLEVGLRAVLPRGWRLEGAFFRTGLRDELVPFEVPQAPGRTFFRNAGSSTHRGWEATVEGRPDDWVSLRVAYTRVDARFDTYVVEGEDHSGNRIPGLSPHRLDGRFLLSRGPAYAELRGLYQEAFPVDDEASITSPPYFLADLKFGFEQVRLGAITVSPFLSVANLLNRRYNASVVVNAFGGRFFEPGPGRTFQVGLSVVFNPSPETP